MKSRSNKSRAAQKKDRDYDYQTLEPRQMLAADFVISEFQASNSSTLVDDNGNSSDWIEIHNAGDSAGNLSGYSLTDDLSETDKWSFPSRVLQPNEFLVVFADDDANPTFGNDLYTGFKLSASGEYLGLFDPAGTVVSSYDSVAGAYPAQQSDGSYGLAFTAGGNPLLVEPIVEGFFVDPTPGEENSQQFAGIVAPVVFSVDAGFYDAQFPLSLTTTTPGAGIRFTVDGSEPTLTNGFTYNSSFDVSSSLNLRAAAFRTGYVSAPIETRTYLFLDDVLDQSSNESPPNGWPSSWGSKDVDYGMDPQVIAIEGEQAVKDALLAIPSWSITTDLDNLFDPNDGIYSNATQDGRDWERPASVELINPDGSEGFQINGGLRVRGGFSRGDFNPKSSFRLFFRGEYGQSTLNYPIHGDEGVDEFRKIDLRTAQNYSWSSGADTRNNFVQDVLARYAQRDLGQPYTRSSWLHLYLNGQYWGLYQTQERAESNFAASYFGGDPDEYDVIKAQWTASNPTDGNLTAYHELSAQARARAADGRTPAFVDNAAYYKAQGLNPDGTANASYDTLLDVDNLISYMMIVLAGGNLDAPISNFGNNERVNNYYTIRNRNGDEGFKFFAHDSEHTLLNVDENRNGPWNSPNFDNSNALFNPQWLHQQLMANDEYRLRFADNVQAAFFNDGPLSAEAQIARLDEEAAKIDQAIIAESVRWGDSKRSNPLLRSDWVGAINNIRDNFLENRNSILINQFKNTELRLKDNSGNYSIVVNAPLVPDVDAPKYLVGATPQHGGDVAAGTEVTPASGAGTVWYTTDGSDPRESGGAVSVNAALFTGATTNTSVVQAGSNWRYDDTGTDLGTAWRADNYNDSGWGQGDAQLGYGDGDETTVVSFGNNNNDKHPTTYFRKQFMTPVGVDAGNVTAVKFRFVRDDGIVAYLNGVEIARNNLPGGTISYGTTATNVVSASEESAWFEVTVPISALRTDSLNTLAVEVHQYNEVQGGDVTSSDLSFNAELILTTIGSSSSPIVIDESTTLRARAQAADGTWSALQVANFVVSNEPASAANLRVTEIHYNALDSGVEFIEIQNVTSGATATTIDLGGVRLTDGPSETFEFSIVQSLAAGERGLLVNDVTAFEAAYPDVDPSLILGEFSGSLSNGGERIRLASASGQDILDFSYNDNEPWSFLADGGGASLELIDPAATPADQLGKAYRWRPSVLVGGTPGAAGDAPRGVVINEVLAHTDLPAVDAIELHNPTGAAIDVGDLFLSDSADFLFKFKIPTGTVIPAGGYLVYDESDFNPTPATPTTSHFALNSSGGDRVLLSRGEFDGPILRSYIEDSVSFGATFNGQSVGRLPNGSGRLTRLADVSLGSVNGNAAVGPLVISEFNYHPADPTAAALQIEPNLDDDDLEFIEIHNPTGSAINLEDWQIRGEVDYDFADVSLPAGESLVVLSFDPTLIANATRLSAFQTHYGISGALFDGPWTGGSLSNGSGRIALRQPDAPDADIIPRVVVDEVVYDDISPWGNADGTGGSLNRVGVNSVGNQPASWMANVPTPGVAVLATDPATVVANVRDSGDLSRPDQWTSQATTFSTPVSLTSSAMTLVNLSDEGTFVDLAGVGFSYDAQAFTATWNLSSLNLAAGYYQMFLSSVQDASSNLPLDGDADGQAGGSFADVFYVAIPGDANLDGRVDVLNDASALVNRLGTNGGAVWATGDFDGNGAVDVLGDAAILVDNLGRNVTPLVNAAAMSLPSMTIGMVSSNAIPIGQPSLVMQNAAQRTMSARLPRFEDSTQPDSLLTGALESAVVPSASFNEFSEEPTVTSKKSLDQFFETSDSLADFEAADLTFL